MKFRLPILSDYQKTVLRLQSRCVRCRICCANRRCSHDILHLTEEKLGQKLLSLRTQLLSSSNEMREEFSGSDINPSIVSVSIDALGCDGGNIRKFIERYPAEPFMFTYCISSLEDLEFNLSPAFLRRGQAESGKTW